MQRARHCGDDDDWPLGAAGGRVPAALSDYRRHPLAGCGATAGDAPGRHTAGDLGTREGVDRRHGPAHQTRAGGRARAHRAKRR